jgi:hypothetical protein
LRLLESLARQAMELVLRLRQHPPARRNPPHYRRHYLPESTGPAPSGNQPPRHPRGQPR